MRYREATVDQVIAIREASAKVRGTDDWVRYYVPIEYKSKYGWKFLGWGTPSLLDQARYYFKHTSTGEYLYQDHPLQELVRYQLTEPVLQLLGM